MKLLLNDNRVDINKTDNEGKTPFYIACFKGWTEVVKCLLESGREININKANKNDNTPFYSACLYGHIEIVKSLVNDKRIDIKKADIIGKTPFYRVCSEGYIEMVKYMLACGRQIDINKKDDQGKDFERKSDHLKIVELIESFKRSQSENETRTILRIQLGFAGEFISFSFLFLSFFFCFFLFSFFHFLFSFFIFHFLNNKLTSRCQCCFYMCNDCSSFRSLSRIEN